MNLVFLSVAIVVAASHQTGFVEAEGSVSDVVGLPNKRHVLSVH